MSKLPWLALLVGLLLGSVVLADGGSPPVHTEIRRPIEPNRRAWIIFKEGARVVSVGEWKIKPPLVIFHGDNQTLYSVRLDTIDFEATRRSNGVPPPKPGAIIELELSESSRSPQIDSDISLTPEQRARQKGAERAIRKLGEELTCITEARSSLESEICRLRVELAYH